MLCIEEPAAAEIIVKKSRFLAEIFPLFSQKEARSLLKAQKERHKGASHVAHAFILSSPEVCGCSDDGEPSGTAGRPILNVLKGANLSDCIVTVARWFGGTLLGTGGLSRAYAEAAKGAIAAANPKERVRLAYFSAEVPYRLVAGFLRLAQDADARIFEQGFEASYSLIKGAIPKENEENFARDVAALSSNSIRLEFCPASL